MPELVVPEPVLPEGEYAARVPGDCAAAGQAVALVPRVPLRHWVLTLPAPDVSPAAAGPGLAGVVRAFVGALFCTFRTTSAGPGPALPAAAERVRRCGAVTVSQLKGVRVDSSLLVHALMLDGVYFEVGAGAPPVFVPHAGAPEAEEVAACVRARLRRARVHGRLRVTQVPVAGPRLGAARYPCLASRTREGWVRFSLPFALSDGTRLAELSPDAIADRLGRLVDRGTRRVRFHGVLAAGSGRGCHPAEHD